MPLTAPLAFLGLTSLPDHCFGHRAVTAPAQRFLLLPESLEQTHKDLSFPHFFNERKQAQRKKLLGQGLRARKEEAELRFEPGSRDPL